MVPFKSSYFRSMTRHTGSICFPTSSSRGALHDPNISCRGLTLSGPDTRRMEKGHQNRKLPSTVAAQVLNWLLLHLLVLLKSSSPLARCLMKTCFISDIKLDQHPRRKLLDENQGSVSTHWQ